MSTAKPHLSHAQLNMLSICGEQYRRRYPENEKIPPGIALNIGTGAHTGAEVNFLQKIESHTDLPKNEIVEAAVAGYETAFADGYTLAEDERKRGASIVIAEGKDLVASLADLHARESAPEYQPVAVEQEILIPFPNATHDLLGYVDVTDDLNRVTDFKTAGKSKNQNEADTSVQLTIYAAAHQIATGAPPAEVRLDVLVKTKKPKRQVLSSTRGQPDFLALINRVNIALAVIQAGTYMPVEPGHWMCGPKWCGYWSTCRFVNNERKAAAESE